MSKLKGTRLNPEEFPLTTNRALEASKRGLDVQETFDDFSDYWTALPGSKALKLDWDATWRNWCRKAKSFAKPWQLNVNVNLSQQRTASDQAAISALHARRAQLGIGIFRDINEGESVSDYRRAQNDAIDSRHARPLRLVK